MEIIPELQSPVHINKENQGSAASPVTKTGQTPMSSPSLRTKKSLSILSANEVAQRSQLQGRNNFTKPIQQRVISQSTGLVKFSLRSKPQVASSDEASKSLLHGEDLHHNYADFGLESPDRKAGLPVYIPVDSPVKIGFSEQMMNPFLSPKASDKKNGANGVADPLYVVNPEEELLFNYAKKQRQVMELKSRLESAESELKELERQLTETKLGTNPFESPELGSSSKFMNLTTPVVLEFKRKLQETTTTLAQNNIALRNNGATPSPIKQVLESKVSMLSFSTNASDPASTNQNGGNGLSKRPSMLKMRKDLQFFTDNGRKLQTEFLTKGRQFIDNFQAFGNTTRQSDTHTQMPSPPQDLELQEKDEEEYEFGGKGDYSENHDLTYTSDVHDTESIEDLEGGEAVPYYVS